MDETSATPAWLPETVFYALNPDRFCRPQVTGTEEWDATRFEDWDATPAHKAYKGGNLTGVIDRLDYVAELGVNAIYLTPIFSSTAHHRYKTIDPFEVDPLLGGMPAFERLMEECRRRGIRVMLDAVFNHVGLGFRGFVDVLEYGKASPWYDWFLIDGWPLNPFDLSRPANYRCWNEIRTMPELNHEYPGVRRFILRVLEHWSRKGIDGWRLDCPAKVGDAEFWRQVRQRLKAIRPDLYILGEIWTDASQWLDGSQWDGVTNYPMMGAWQRFVAGERVLKEHLLEGARDSTPLDASGFAREVEILLGRYAWQHQLAALNFLSTHDIARFRTVAGGDESSMRLGCTLLFTFPGVPCIYYGDEVGMEGGLPPDSRRGFPAPDRWVHDTLDDHKALIRIRRKHPALQTGRFQTLFAKRMLFAFARTQPGETIVTAVNAGTSNDSAVVSLNSEKDSKFERLFGPGLAEPLGNAQLSLSLPPRSATIFAVV